MEIVKRTRRSTHKIIVLDNETKKSRAISINSNGKTNDELIQIIEKAFSEVN